MRRNEKGAVVPEVALSFFTAMLAAMLFTWGLIIAYRYLAIQHALHKGGRVATVGLSGPSGVSREDYIKQVIIERAQAYGVRLPTENIRLCPASTSQSNLDCEHESAGRGWTFMLISARIPSLFFEPGILRATLLVRNEPF